MPAYYSGVLHRATGSHHDFNFDRAHDIHLPGQFWVVRLYFALRSPNKFVVALRLLRLDT
jgi:hypothetical protein